MRETRDQTPLSMTATGAASFEVQGRAYLLELKSLNSRGLDVKCLLPEALSHLEAPLRAELKGRLTRGKVELKLMTRSPSAHSQGEGSAQGGSLNYEQVTTYARLCLELKGHLRSIGAPQELSAAEVLLWPDVLLHHPTPAVDDGLIKASLFPALSSALEQLIEMRRAEGEALYQVLTAHMTQMRALLFGLHEALPELAERRSQGLKARLEVLLQGEAINPQDPRLLIELALLADKADVTEELNRIDAHLAHLERLLTSGSPSGRRCDFLCQELLRETNTASAKLHDVGVTHLLVELKAEVERLREQIQNIE